jgi:hypothetical protein
MTNRGKKQVRDAGSEKGAILKKNEVPVPERTPPAFDTPTPILQSEDDEGSHDEDSPK